MEWLVGNFWRPSSGLAAVPSNPILRDARFYQINLPSHVGNSGTPIDVGFEDTQSLFLYA